MKYDFRVFVQRYKLADPDDLLDILRDEPDDCNISSHCKECIELGIKLLESEFDSNARRLILENSIGFVTSILLSSGSDEDRFVAAAAVSSESFRKMMTLMFYYTIGLSNKEGI